MSTDEYRIEQFVLEEGSYEAFAQLISEAFLHDEAAQKEGTTIWFNAMTFKRMFGSPFTPRDFFVRAIHIPTKELVGFVGIIPRPMIMRGKRYQVAIPSWAAVHPRHQRKGISKRLGMKVVEILDAKHYDFAFSLHEPEQHGKDASAAVTRDHNLTPLHTLMYIRNFLIRVFDVDRMKTVMKLKPIEALGLKLFTRIQSWQNPRIRPMKPEDGERLFELLKDHIDRNDMAMIRDHDDFLWYLSQPGINCQVHEDEHGQVDGFLLAWEFTFAGFGQTIPFGWLDLVHLHRLARKDAIDLCKAFAQTSKAMGWVGVQSPFIPYFDPAPFQKAKYLFFPKTLLMDVFHHKDFTFPPDIKTCYYDWR